MSGPNDLKWFCDNCESEMANDQQNQLETLSKKMDDMMELINKVVGVTETLQDKLNEKSRYRHSQRSDK